ncbi:MAG TPA: cell division protein FtsL [Acidimicrobiales bacterium]|jgi:cell division protein FtsL|nr:cell division protein FtsL [Acidimicrobiales bacterium]
MTATAQARATATAPVRKAAPAHAAPRRPPLRVVDPAERSAAAQRRRTRLLATGIVLLVALSLFGVVAAHVVLTQNQFRLQKLQHQAAQEQAKYERLRLQVAELESPARVVAAAQERLGMVPPANVKYLTPAKSAAPSPKPAKADSADAGGQQAMTEWSVVKRHLGTRP